MDSTLKNAIDMPGLPLVHRVRMPAHGAAKNSPCLILLHGVGANESNLIDFAQRQDPRMTVILARAPLTLGPNMYGWFNVNFTSTGPVINAAQAEHSRQTLLAFIDALPGAYGIDPARIWIAGFSQGGIISASVGLTRPDKVAGFGILSGRILPEIAPLIANADALKELHAFVSHGIHDGKLSIDFARNAKNLLTESGVQLAYHEYDAAHELNAEMQSDFIRWAASQIDAKK